MFLGVLMQMWYKLAETEREGDQTVRDKEWGKHHYRKQPTYIKKYNSKSTSDLHKMRTEIVTPYAIGY